MPNKPQLGLLLLVILVTGSVSAATVKQQTLDYLNIIRSLHAGTTAQARKKYNNKLDLSWRFFTAHKQTVLPILHMALQSELERDKPNNPILLHVGYFLRQQSGDEEKALAKKALLHIDAGTNEVRARPGELFEFTYAVVGDHDPRILPFIDNVFLKNDVIIKIPGRSLQLDAISTRAFLYGKYGMESEAHLRELLKEPVLVMKIFDILPYIGTPASIPAIKRITETTGDFRIFSSGISLMTAIGGPQGRKAVLSLKPALSSAKARKFLARWRNDEIHVSYALLVSFFSLPSSTPRLSDAELKKCLEQTCPGKHAFDEASLYSTFQTKLPKTYLIPQLQKMRVKMFNDLSDSMLLGVSMVSVALNALYYRSW